MTSSAFTSKLKASEVAAETRHKLIPQMLQTDYAHTIGSVLYRNPCTLPIQHLFRRSSLSATLGINLYPIPSNGVVVSQAVVFRGPHDCYDILPIADWNVLAVVSVPPVRRPRLVPTGVDYSFDAERNMVRDKLRASLLTCIAKGYTSIVVSDFGLGNDYRNPPQEMARLWREAVLSDTVCGHLESVTFVFENPQQCTTWLILDAMNKKNRGNQSRRMSSPLGVGPLSSSSTSASLSLLSTDFEIFRLAFSKEVPERELETRDHKYDLQTLLNPS
ncbi:hypothetical protein SPI_03642 [Niveomyces insectorum RCEF 264]|uniref:Microbial-type PARG catalytic domain-containing protein n=1 Tax=Niveomyces insectorum RCEF 264 TaxID=1081102 RepID=A0A167W8V7_9HYPO|nr:hypothetical protein SPI_03642 [Niveomyces insectorum RCEF 264]